MNGLGDEEQAKRSAEWVFHCHNNPTTEQLRLAVESAIASAIRRERRICSKIAYMVSDEAGFLIANRHSGIVSLDGKSMATISDEINKDVGQ